MTALLKIPILFNQVIIFKASNIVLLHNNPMTIKKLLQKNQLPDCIKLGMGSYIKEPCMRYTLQCIAIQNSLQHLAMATNKYYKTI